MYTIGNKTFADAGCYLKRGSSIGYSFINNEQPIEEYEVMLDDLYSNGFMLLWSNNKIAQMVIPNGTYADYKKAIIQKKYTNDDQIAIMLNMDSGQESDILEYKKMQEWREWASTIASKIIEVLNMSK